MTNMEIYFFQLTVIFLGSLLLLSLLMIQGFLSLTLILPPLSEDHLFVLLGHFISEQLSSVI